MYIDEIQQEIMLKTTSKIECVYTDNTVKTATCFFCQTNSLKIVLVTNKHVFKDCKIAKLYLTVYHQESNLYENIDLTLTLGNDILFHSFYDISTLDITNIYNVLINDGLLPQLNFITETAIITDYSMLHPLQDIVMLGYPSGIINLSTNHPITRIGVTATSIKETYNNHEIFLTDLPTFGGSSGSPIFITNSEGLLFLVGINSETFLQHTPVYSKPRLFQKRKIVGYVDIPNDIGIAINSRIIKEMLANY